MSNDNRARLELLGFDKTNVDNLLNNPQKVKVLFDVVKETGVEEKDLAGLGPLLLPAAGLSKHRALLAQYIGTKKIKRAAQVEAASKFLTEKKSAENIDISAFETAAGVGVEVTKEQIAEIVKAYVTKNQDSLKALRYVHIGQLFSKAKQSDAAFADKIKWAEGAAVINEFKEQCIALWGPLQSGEVADKPLPKEQKKPAAKEASKPKEEKTATTTTTTTTEAKAPTRKFEARELESAINSERLLEEHNKITGGKAVTRFPPEPNGFLHIGHAKAMNLSFGYAAQEGGYTILRYDDTNPEAEDQIYIDSIKEMVDWMGFKYKMITHTSSYFQQMYDFAVYLIKQGKAYVDFSTKEEIKVQRDEKKPSPYRDTSVEENLKRFDDMRKGKYEEGKAVLRCKIDMQHDNPNMRDFIAYRIKYVPHPVAGDKWCVYPTYDYSHCIVDSLEHITHSLCTLEFEIRRDPYYWVLQNLDIYRPHVWEFSRLNIKKSFLSKRKVNKLVKEGYVRGWDDPRLLTLAGLRRRGYTPEAIKKFCDDIGVSRNENLIPMEKLEGSLRADLDERANRVFVVMDPLKITLVNYPEGKVEYVDAPNHPVKTERGKRKLPFSKVIYIERKDFREQDSKDYFGLAPNKEVGLRYAYNIKCVNVKKNEKGEVVELECEADFEKKNKPKGHIHWLAQPQPGQDPKTAEIRIYDDLFDLDVPDSVPDWLAMMNKDSEHIIKNAFVDPAFTETANCAVFTKYQFERLGFFSVDVDSKPDALVFNRAVTLKESYPKFSNDKK